MSGQQMLAAFYRWVTAPDVLSHSGEVPNTADTRGVGDFCATGAARGESCDCHSGDAVLAQAATARVVEEDRKVRS
jgi:hypothetical protein